VKDAVIVPADTKANTPVVMHAMNLRTPECDWLVEQRRLRPGVMVSCSLLSGKNEFAALRVVNISGEERMLMGVMVADAES
jgi:hypothetical protein